MRYLLLLKLTLHLNDFTNTGRVTEQTDRHMKKVKIEEKLGRERKSQTE